MPTNNYLFLVLTILYIRFDGTVIISQIVVSGTIDRVFRKRTFTKFPDVGFTFGERLTTLTTETHKTRHRNN